MDLADADAGRLLRTIRQFRLLNRLLSASRRLLRFYVFARMEQDPGRVYTLLDVGAGGCDIVQWAALEARRRGLQLQITALYNDPRILPVAREAVRDYPEIRLVEGDALDLGSLGTFDFVISNHLLHHLSWEEIILFLQGVHDRTRLVWMMNDLKRSRWAFLGATFCLGLLAPRSFAFADGRLSIRKGFRPEELRNLVQRHLPGISVEVLETAPARVVLVGRKVQSVRISPEPPL
jgi:2-polyprenyl-3-methyl-5-hydroxy-6-metoxy-1,4-benzoquinol methylase